MVNGGALCRKVFSKSLKGHHCFGKIFNCPVQLTSSCCCTISLSGAVACWEICNGLCPVALASEDTCSSQVVSAQYASSVTRPGSYSTTRQMWNGSPPAIWTICPWSRSQTAPHYNYRSARMAHLLHLEMRGSKADQQYQAGNFQRLKSLFLHILRVHSDLAWPEVLRCYQILSHCVDVL